MTTLLVITKQDIGGLTYRGYGYAYPYDPPVGVNPYDPALRCYSGYRAEPYP